MSHSLLFFSSFEPASWYPWDLNWLPYHRIPAAAVEDTRKASVAVNKWGADEASCHESRCEHVLDLVICGHRSPTNIHLDFPFSFSVLSVSVSPSPLNPTLLCLSVHLCPPDLDVPPAFPLSLHLNHHTLPLRYPPPFSITVVPGRFILVGPEWKDEFLSEHVKKEADVWMLMLTC